MENGELIIMEGACDGIGKSTQYQRLCDHLQKDGLEIINHHFPSYGTYHAASVERYLKGELGQPNTLSPYFINSLYATDRGVVWVTKLKELYEQGKTIILDRYTTSSIIYQSAEIDDFEEKKDFIDYITDFEYNKIGIKKPDNVIFLHAPFDLVTEIRKARRQNGGIENDIHESNLEFMRKVYNNSMFVADYLGWDMIRCDDGEKMRSIEDIHDDVYRLVKNKTKIKQKIK